MSNWLVQTSNSKSQVEEMVFLSNLSDHQRLLTNDLSESGKKNLVFATKDGSTHQKARQFESLVLGMDEA